MSDWLWVHHQKFVAGGLLLVAVVAFLNCGGCGLVAPDGTITGQVTTKDGKPVVWGTVTVIASDNTTHTAPIAPDGTYTVKGLPPGPVRLAVSSPNPRPDEPPPAGAAGGPGGRLGRPGVKGGSGGGAETDGGGGMSVKVGGGQTKGGAGGGGRNPKDKKQTYGVDAVLAQPDKVAPTNLPPQELWVPIPGKYSNPNTSGLNTAAGGGVTQFNITAE